MYSVNAHCTNLAVITYTVTQLVVVVVALLLRPL